jgi:hypothetical protein
VSVPFDIDEEFAELEYLFGSKKRKRRAKQEEEEELSWDAKPVVKILRGKPTEFFYIGSLAQALGKSVKTIRYWEKSSYIPKSPYRLPGYMRGSTKIPGKRLLTRELIDIVVEEFDKRGLLGKSRVDWNLHDDLTAVLIERWEKSVNRSANTIAVTRR